MNGATNITKRERILIGSEQTVIRFIDLPRFLEFGFEAVNLIEVFPWCQRFASRSALCRCSSFPTNAASLAKIRKPRVKYQMF